MESFTDLNEEIGADDWLIPRHEITRRRLVRQTKQYKIYKADWFGDVLVYEPIECCAATEIDKQRINDQSNDLNSRRRQSARYPHQDFNSQLSELCLKLNSSSTSTIGSPLSPMRSDYDDDLDSAYSSISSTPQFRNTKQHKFQFPSGSGSLTSIELQQQQRGQEDILISACSLLLPAEECLKGQDDVESATTSLARKSRKNAGPSSLPVILNKSSFFHDDDQHDELLLDNATHMSKAKVATNTTSSWFELNELRLVAHENFLLFMGASLENESLVEATGSSSSSSSSSHSNTSLVMQMSHPKSMSLFNLLHANKCNESTPMSSVVGTCSPIDRFFALERQQQQKQQHLSIAAKLNICQQVTNAMTYLHDKNIVHGRLTSVNIYLELNQRVKISLLDNDEQSAFGVGVEKVDTNGSGSNNSNLPTLTYLSPELVRTITSSSSENKCARLQVNTQMLTKESDIYSFGTLLYELFHEKFPYAEDQITTTSKSPTTPSLNGAELFEQLCLAAQSPTRSTRLSPMTPSPRLHQQPLSPFTSVIRKHWNGNIKYSASELIFHIGSGQTAVKNLHHQDNSTRQQTPALVDQIISNCWSSQPHERPTFKQLRFE